MTFDSPRVTRNRDLGLRGRRVDVLLGIAAIMPLLGIAALSFMQSGIPAFVIRTMAVIWSACLLTFFAGVRRGLTFSEKEGGRLAELASMLLLFSWGAASLFCCSLPLAAFGFAIVGVFDALASRRGDVPHYFGVFRPVQMAVGVAALIVVQMRTI